jgi:hypothetical protein
MNEGDNARDVIPAHRVRRVSQPALIDCAEAGASGNALSVVPLMDGARVAGIEVRCRCGASVLVECVYDDAEVKP